MRQWHVFLNLQNGKEYKVPSKDKFSDLTDKHEPILGIYRSMITFLYINRDLLTMRIYENIFSYMGFVRGSPHSVLPVLLVLFLT